MLNINQFQILRFIRKILSLVIIFPKYPDFFTKYKVMDKKFLFKVKIPKNEVVFQHSCGNCGYIPPIYFKTT